MDPLMEGEGGDYGGGFIGADNTFERENSVKNKPTPLSSRPLSVMHRVLDGQKNLEGTLIQGSGLVSGFSSKPIDSSNNCFLGDMGWPCHQDVSFMNNSSFGENGSKWSYNHGHNQANPNHDQGNLEVGGEEELTVEKGESSGGSNKRPKIDHNILVKDQWTEEEDRRLIRLVEQYGEKKWAHIAVQLNGRIGKQCRERWHNQLRPNIKKESWSEEEERMLVMAHSQIGNKWTRIAKCIPGRTENSIKNHWNATKRRYQNSTKRHRHRQQQQKTSILQEYIKSLDLRANTNYAPTLSDGPSSHSGFSVIPEVASVLEPEIVGQNSQVPVQINSDTWVDGYRVIPEVASVPEDDHNSQVPVQINSGTWDNNLFIQGILGNDTDTDGTIPVAGNVQTFNDSYSLGFIGGHQAPNSSNSVYHNPDSYVSLLLDGSERLTTLGAKNYPQIRAEPFSVNQPNYFPPTTNLPNSIDHMLEDGFKSSFGTPNWYGNMEMDDFINMGSSLGSFTRFSQGGSSSGSRW